MRVSGSHFQRKRRVLPESTSGQFGFFRTDVSFLVLLFFVGILGTHVYSVNGNAVQGYRVRQLEKKIAGMQEENARLRIQEADVKSFQRIDEARESLSLDQSSDPQYFEEQDVVAFR